MPTAVHLTLFAVTVAVTAGLLLVEIAAIVAGRSWTVPADRLILAALGALALTTLAGLTLLVTGHRPSDGLHYLYAAVIWLALPVGRYLARTRSDRTRSPRQRAGILAVAAVVMLGLLLRLYMTGSG